MLWISPGSVSYTTPSSRYFLAFPPVSKVDYGARVLLMWFVIEARLNILFSKFFLEMNTPSLNVFKFGGYISNLLYPLRIGESMVCI